MSQETSIIERMFDSRSSRDDEQSAVLALVGVALLLGSVASLAPIPVFAWFIGRYFIRPEEVFLEGLFGAEYLEYKAQVRRWL